MTDTSKRRHNLGGDLALLKKHPSRSRATRQNPTSGVLYARLPARARARFAPLGAAMQARTPIVRRPQTLQPYRYDYANIA